MKEILITGSNGYLGKNLVKYLYKKKLFKIRTLSRKKTNKFKNNIKQITYKNFNNIFNYSKILTNIEAVVHLAAYSNESKKVIDKQEFNNININFLKKLLKECNKFQIKKFIFISSAKVYGEHNVNDKSFETNSNENPQNHYSQSKLIGEKIVKKYCKIYNINFLIIRMPMVYGENNNRNFQLLESYVKYHLPIPLKNFKNTKSVLHIENFCEFIFQILKINNFKKKTVNICDNQDLLIFDLINYFIKKYNTKNLIIYLPIKLIELFFYFIGKKNLFIKLFLNNKISNSSAKNYYKWSPKYTFKDYI